MLRYALKHTKLKIRENCLWSIIIKKTIDFLLVKLNMITEKKRRKYNQLLSFKFSA